MPSTAAVFKVLEYSLVLCEKIYRLFKKKPKKQEPVNQLSLKDTLHIQAQIKAGVDKSREKNSLSKKDR